MRVLELEETAGTIAGARKIQSMPHSRIKRPIQVLVQYGIVLLELYEHGCGENLSTHAEGRTAFVRYVVNQLYVHELLVLAWGKISGLGSARGAKEVGKLVKCLAMSFPYPGVRKVVAEMMG